MIKKIFSVLLSATLGMCIMPVSAASNSDYALMREQYKNYLIGSNVDFEDLDIKERVMALDTVVAGHLSALIYPGTTSIFSDLSPSGTNMGSRDLSAVFERTRQMAIAYKTPGSVYFGNSSLLEKTINVLDRMEQYFYNSVKVKDYYPADYSTSTTACTGNWYDFEIAAPRALCETVLVIYDELPTDKLNKYMDAVDAFSPSPYYGLGGVGGANGVWKARIVILRAMLIDNPTHTSPNPNNPNPHEKDAAMYNFDNKLAAAVSCVNNLIGFVNVTSSGGYLEGFYNDGSYIGHAANPYHGLYGMGMLESSISLYDTLKGTSFALPQSKLETIQTWVYENMAPFMYGKDYMSSVRGRTVGRADSMLGREIGRELCEEDGAGKFFMTALTQLSNNLSGQEQLKLNSLIKQYAMKEIEYESGSTASLYAFNSPFTISTIKSILSDDSINPSTNYTDYHKHFPIDERFVHTRADWGVIANMYSTKMYNHETGGEFNTGYHAGDGMLYLYDGDLDRYNNNFFATVDPQRMVGTTVLSGTTMVGNTKGKNTWSGGTWIDSYGVAGFTLSPSPQSLTANKSWFMFDNEVVALGSGISATTETNNVETIIENKVLKEDNSNILTVDQVSQGTALEEKSLSNAVWAHLDNNVKGNGTGYYFPGGANIIVKREQRSGSWSTINNFFFTTDVHSNYFASMRINHGQRPVDGNYAYVLLPNKTASETKSYSENPRIEVLSNTKNIQSVRHLDLGIEMANFFGSAVTKTGLITAGGDATVMVLDNGDNYTVAVSDPTKVRTDKMKIRVDLPCISVVSCDNGIVVEKLGDELAFNVDVAGSLSKTFRITVSKTPISSGKAAYSENFDGEWSKNIVTNTNSGAAWTNKINSYDSVLNVTLGNAPAFEESFESSTAFDGWSQTKPTAPYITNEQARTGANSIKLQGIVGRGKSLVLGQYKAEVYIYDSDITKTSTAIFGLNDDIKIGLYSGWSNAYYALRIGSLTATAKVTTVPRSVGWHKISFIPTSATTAEIYIDDNLVHSFNYSTPISKVELADYWGNNVAAPAYMDDLKITPVDFEDTVVNNNIFESFENGIPSNWSAVSNKLPLNVVSTTISHSGSKAIKLENATTVQSLALAKDNYIISAYIYDGDISNRSTAILNVNDSVYFGLYGNANPTYYVFRTGSGFVPSSVLRSVGWHKFTFDFSSGTDLKLLIDDILVKTIADISGCTKLSMGDWWNSGNTVAAYIDDLSIVSPQVLNEDKVIRLTHNTPFTGSGTVLSAVYEAAVYTDYSLEKPVTLFGVGINGNTDYAVKVDIAGGKLFAFAKGQTPVEISGAANGAWHIFRASVNNHNVTLYVDGKMYINNLPVSGVDIVNSIYHEIKDTKADLLVDNIRIYEGEDKCLGFGADVTPRMFSAGKPITQIPSINDVYSIKAQNSNLPMYVAIYKDGKLIESFVGIAEDDITAVLNKTYTIGDCIKIFRWDDDLKPVCDYTLIQ